MRMRMRMRMRMSNHNPRVRMRVRMMVQTMMSSSKFSLSYNIFYQVGTYNDERFDRDIASVTSSLDVRLKSVLGIMYGEEKLGGSIILIDT